jgi:hypothetical protein
MLRMAAVSWLNVSAVLRTYAHWVDESVGVDVGMLIKRQ